MNLPRTQFPQVENPYMLEHRIVEHSHWKLESFLDKLARSHLDLEVSKDLFAKSNHRPTPPPEGMSTSLW